MKEQIKELLDIYERFGKDAQGALDFVLRNLERVYGSRGPVELDLTRLPKADPKMPVAVDLGLPSGRLWADRNVGAAAPEHYGLYFSWGNVDGVNGGRNDVQFDFSKEAYESTEGSYIDDADIDPDGGLDAARVNLGEPWRMPTSGDFKELYDNCTTEWGELNGVKGMYFKSNINGNSIFLPASGDGAGASWYNRGSYGIYWSASFVSSRSARSLYFNSGGVYPQYNNDRYLGFAVRAVQN